MYSELKKRIKQRENAKKKAEKVRSSSWSTCISTTHHPCLLEQAAAAPAQPQAKVSAAEAEEELSPNVSDQLTLL